jgi:RND superfamily putative drug exporter
VLSARPIGVRHPKLTLGAAVAVLALLAVVGSGVEARLRLTSTTVPGTESSRADALLRVHFGESAPFAILLRGPAAALERQGPRLVATLWRVPEVTAISPWDRGVGLAGLRPNRRTALLLVDFHVSAETAMTETVPRLERLVAKAVRPPLRSRIAGFASLARAIRDESVAVTRRGEAILAPILLLVLLLVFRSPVAAFVPIAFGACTVIVTRGLIVPLTGLVDIDAFALSISTMIGLALGVDYALLIVSRFREELCRGLEPAAAAAATRATAGRTTAFAGAVLLTAVLFAALLVPGALLLSFCAAVAPAIAVAVAGPWVVAPALLTLLGPSVNRWRIGGRDIQATRLLRLSQVALRRPGAAAIAAGLLILLLIVPASSLATGAVTIEQLPASDPTRRNVEAIEAAVGAGWISPSVVVAVDPRGPITTPRRLAELKRWQKRIWREGEVAAVIGPGRLVRRLAPLRRFSREFAAGGRRTRERLTRSVDALAGLRRGLGRGNRATLALRLGTERARAGTGKIAEGLSLAVAAGHSAQGAVGRFRHGTQRLAEGQHLLGLAVSTLEFAVAELDSEMVRGALPEARRLADVLRRRATAPARDAEMAATDVLAKLEEAWRELNAMTTGTADAHFPGLENAIREALTAASGKDPDGGDAYAPGYEGLPAATAELGGGIRESSSIAATLQSRLAELAHSATYARGLAQRLRREVARLERGSDKLAAGADRIAAGAEHLPGGLDRLSTGARRLEGGLGQIGEGQERLGRGLSAAFRRTAPLVRGGRRMEAQVLAASHGLRHGSPGFFDSGYFVLSALDGAPRRSRSLVGQTIDLRGGQAAKILVVGASRGPHEEADPTAAYERLRRQARGLARETGLRVAVTGGVAESSDYERATSARLPALVLAITVVTFLAMLAVLRALPLALLAISLNLLVVGAAFGVLELLTLLPASVPLGGAQQVDPVGAAAIFGVVFGLSIDYSVFLLVRMREAWEWSGDNEKAISHGLDRTAGVIAGAATIMAVVFVVLATAPIQSVSQFGVSLAVAVLLDATVVRMMLLPALMNLAGPRIWWLPGWLGRRLPRLAAEDVWAPRS